MTWRLPDTYHSAGTRRGTATLKFYEGRDILIIEADLFFLHLAGDLCTVVVRANNRIAAAAVRPEAPSRRRDMLGIG